MAKHKESSSQSDSHASHLTFLSQGSDPWRDRLLSVVSRFNQEYRREAFELPEAVEAMPIFQEWAKGSLQARVASPFWQLVQPRKQQRCLDIGCGVSFLVYPWREWDAFFYGQEVSILARDMLVSRGPQLNSKLFKGVQVGPAHLLNYQAAQFDLAIATGFSCYYPRDYWSQVLAAVKPILKPEGFFVFDVLNPDLPLSENWAILEMYLGAEVFLDSLSDWEQTISTSGAKILAHQDGDLFRLYKVKF
ncbi:MAG: methyltransferase domain-containing protein [Leptolyngbyaceae cyanobacterium bins.59]|nr:methyltransferase domain-containing protein [Leptolyngbyaceae cyanobacterium bins.59]